MSLQALDRTARRITGTIFLTESLFSAAFLAAVTLLSINAVELGGGDQYAGVPSTMSLLGRAAIAVPIGILMDRAGRRPAMLLGYIFGALGFAVAALAVGWSSFFVLCLGAGLAGVANGASQQARYIASEVWPDDNRARVIGLIVFAGTIGAIFGPLLVGPTGTFGQQWGISVYAGPYWFGAALTLLAALLIFLLLRPDPMELSRRREADRRADAAEGSTGGGAPAARALRLIFGLPLVQVAVASMVVGQLVMTLIMVITPVHMHHLDHTTGEISLVFTAHTLGMFGLATVTGWLIDRLGSLPMIAYGAVLLIVASFLTPVADSVPALAVGLFVLGLGWNFCFVAGSALLSSQLHYDERGRVQGANELLIALASGSGSLLTGAIFAGGGMLRVGAVGLAITLIFVVFAAWRGRRRTALAAS
jgi:MFS family permease